MTDHSNRARVWHAVERDDTLTKLQKQAFAWLIALGYADGPLPVDRKGLAARLQAMGHRGDAHHVSYFIRDMEEKGYIRRWKGSRISLVLPHAAERSYAAGTWKGEGTT